ncbi:hypothetical protein CEXT_307201 [Caerostris extrusa]|uniref:Uncharacterized protein n=1 Tax=Caerostris extrusa TaxID=172846 RepID=A0AAV4TQP0_CAEEX|nr:hypothetical protein CEXT_307201 [Caerostris extrusa]
MVFMVCILNISRCLEENRMFVFISFIHLGISESGVAIEHIERIHLWQMLNIAYETRNKPAEYYTLHLCKVKSFFKFTPFPNICPSGVSHETFLPEAEAERLIKERTIFYPEPYQPHFDMRSSAKIGSLRHFITLLGHQSKAADRRGRPRE